MVADQPAGSEIGCTASGGGGWHLVAESARPAIGSVARRIDGQHLAALLPCASVTGTNPCRRPRPIHPI